MDAWLNEIYLSCLWKRVLIVYVCVCGCEYVCLCVCVCPCMRLCVKELHHSGFYTSRSDTEIPHKLWVESVRWSHFLLMNINHMNNALSWIECNGIYLWKRWLYSFKVSLGIEAASNQLNKLTPADHQTYQGDVGPMSDYWEGFTKGLGYRHIWHLEKKNTSDLSLYCDHIFLLWLCSELSKVSFCWSWTVWDQARPSSATVYNIGVDCI